MMTTTTNRSSTSVSMAPGTAELPLTPSARTALVQQLSHQRNLLKWVSIATTVVMVAIVAGEGAATRGISWLLVGIMLAADLVTLGFVWTSAYLLLGRGVRRDLAAGVMMRTSGPIQRKQVSGGGDNTDKYYLLIGPHRVEIDRDGFIGVERSQITRGAVDFAPKSHLVFEVRDETARVVYRRLGYSGEQPPAA